MSINLSEQEIRDLTQKIQRKAQARELRALGIPYSARLDGSLVVLKENLPIVHAGAGRAALDPASPNWGAM
ncbi:DUF4224 domain-containing protein [Massilia sp. W12]|uniref:DUF4224 domain-containing protein n=1 Tax=Massilia sp. W12 TaxID=3126507 RepID=UPI0030CEDFF8